MSEKKIRNALCINEWMRKGRTPRINCNVSYLYLSNNTHSFTNRIFNFIFLAMTRHRKELILSEINEPIYIITGCDLYPIPPKGIWERRGNFVLCVVSRNQEASKGLRGFFCACDFYYISKILVNYFKNEENSWMDYFLLVEKILEVTWQPHDNNVTVVIFTFPPFFTCIV